MPSRFYRKLQDIRLNFNVTIIMIIMIITYITFSPDLFESELFQLKAIFLFTIYVLMGLISDDVTGVGDLFAQIWRIDKFGSDDRIKITLIENALETVNLHWGRVWDSLSEPALKKTFVTTKDQLTYNLNILKERITKGSLSFFQIVWITGYIGYIFFFSTNVFNFSTPSDIFINVIFYMVLMVTSGDIKGIGEFLKQLKTTVTNPNDEQANEVMRNISNMIMSLSHKYYLVQNAIYRVDQEIVKNKNGK